MRILSAMRRCLLAVMCISLACVAGTSEARVPKDFFGIDAGPLIDASSEYVDSELAAMASDGLQVVRTQAITLMPPTPFTRDYYWTADDAFELSAAAAGVRWYPFIGYAPNTPPGPHPTARKRVPDYAAYAAGLARRYGPHGSFWQEHPSLPKLPVTTYEIWNEENSTAYWRPQRTAPERYAELYVAARKAIKRVQPGARVIVGGLAAGGSASTIDEVHFLRRMFAHRPSLRRNLDAVAFHPYQRSVAKVYARIARLRRALDILAGPQVPIEITEVGWSKKHFSESTRAADLARLALELPRSDCNVTRLIPFDWIDPISAGFGLVDVDGSTRPSGRAYFHAVKRMRGLSTRPAPEGRVRICH
jgi:hypothetical protein